MHMITKQVVFIFCYLVLCEVHCTNREISCRFISIIIALLSNIYLYFQSVTELPESMAAPLTLLVMLLVIMTATGVLSILASATILLCRLVIVTEIVGSVRVTSWLYSEVSHGYILRSIMVT